MLECRGWFAHISVRPSSAHSKACRFGIAAAIALNEGNLRAFRTWTRVRFGIHVRQLLWLVTSKSNW